MTHIEKYHQEIKEIYEEMDAVYEIYFDNKRYRWKPIPFDASEWKYYKDFLGAAFFKEWYKTSVTTYLNFLISRIRNLKLKIDRERYKKFRK